MTTSEDGAGSLGREEGPNDPHDEDDTSEQQQDLGHIIEEEGDGVAKATVPFDRRE